MMIVTDCILFLVLEILPSTYGTRVLKLKSIPHKAVVVVDVGLEMSAGEQIKLCRPEYRREMPIGDYEDFDK